MLGPFRIRNLKPYHQPPLPHTERLSACEVVVSLTGNEYQKNADTHPDSRLKYIDEDDGETVTVGSSAELASRLQDVIPKRVRRVSASSHPSSKMSTEPTRPLTPDMHVFEIDRTANSLRIWQDIEQHHKEMITQADQAAALFQHGRRDNDMEVHCDPSDDAARLQEMQEEDGAAAFKTPVDPKKLDENVRSFHFARSNPPQIPARHKTKTSEEDSLARYHKWGDSMMDRVSLALPKAPVTAPSLPNALPFPSGISNDGKLTAEGQRQAIEAGSLLRMRNHPAWYPQPASLSGQKPSNRWATYGTSKISMVPNDVSNKSFDPIKTPAAAPYTQSAPKVEQPAPLLQMFREELAKISKPMERLELNSDWKAACENAQEPGASPLSASTTQLTKDPKPDLNIELILIVEQLMKGINSLAIDAQARFTRSINDIGTTADQKNTSISKDVLAVILKEFKIVTSTALETSRAAIVGATPPLTPELDIATSQALVKSLKELSKGIDTFVTLLSAAALNPQPQQGPAPKTDFPNEPLEIEIGNIPDSAGQEQVRNLILRALSIDGPFSGKPSDILSIRIVPATSEKARVAQIKFRSHQVAVHVITHLKGSQFGGKTLSTAVPRDLNRREKSKEDRNADENAETKPLFIGFDEPLDRKPKLTQELPFAVRSSIQTTSTDKPKESVKDEKHNNIVDSTTKKSKAPNVRFADLPSIPGKRPVSLMAMPGAVNVPRNEPTISFRHVPSPMPGATIGRRRSYQFIRSPSFKSQDDAAYHDAPMYYNEWLKPSRTADPSKELQRGQAGSTENDAQLQRATETGIEEFENNPWLEDVARSIDGLQQLKKKPSRFMDDQQHAEKEGSTFNTLPSDAWSGSFSNSIEKTHHAIPFPRDAPTSRITASTSWASLAGKYPYNGRPVSFHLDANTSNSKPFISHYHQPSMSQASTGGWNPYNVKSYHEKSKGGLDDASHTWVGSSGPAFGATGNSGRGYPEANDGKNLRHSMSMGAIRKTNPTPFEKPGSFGLPMRPDAGRDRLPSQTPKPNPLSAYSRGPRPYANENSDSATEAAKFEDEVTAATPAVGVDYLTGNTDTTEPLAPSLPVLEQTRFPTLEQFEQRETAKENATSLVDTLLGFPPLLNMEPLTPVLHKAPEHNNQEREEQRRTIKDKEREQPKCVPLYDAPEHGPNLGGKSHGRDSPFYDAFESPVKLELSFSRQITDANESSGAFFKRMTGRDTSASEVFESPGKSSDSNTESKLATPSTKKSTIESSTPSLGARLVRPFDPLAETAAIHRHQLIEGVARSNTVAGHGDRGKARGRRPYSEYLPRVDDDPQRGSFADLTRPISSYKTGFRQTDSSEKAVIAENEGPIQDKTKEVNEGKADMARFKEVKWGYEWEEKKEAQAKYALRRKSMGNLGSSWNNFGRPASPFMDPRPAPGLPGTAGVSATSLPLPSIATTLPKSSVPGSFPSPPSPPSPINTAPIPDPFPFIDPSKVTFRSFNGDTSSASANASTTKIEKCVEQLRNLGFSKEEDGGLERLKIYAQDADGDVWDAVDMIEGERKVWGERSLGLE